MAFQMQQTVNAALLSHEQRDLIFHLVATNDVHYTYGRRMHRRMISCSASRPDKVVTDENRMRYEGGQYFVKVEEEMSAAVPVCIGGVGKHTEDRGALQCGD